MERKLLKNIQVRRVRKSDKLLLNRYEKYLVNQYANNGSKSYALLALYNGKIVGHITYDNGYLSIEVKYGYRNRGVGSKLIESMIKRNGKLCLEVSLDNHRAIALYEKFGFLPRRRSTGARYGNPYLSMSRK